MKTAYEGIGPRHTQALVILWKGKEAGKIVVSISVHEAPSGGYSHTATVSFWNGPWYFRGTAKAGGYGYCKSSAAISEVMAMDPIRVERHILDPKMPDREKAIHTHSAGMGAVRSLIESVGYQVIEVL